MKKPFLGLLLAVSLTAQGQVDTVSRTTQPVHQSPYSLKIGREAALLGAGVVSYGAAYVFNKNLDPLTVISVSQLNKATIPAYDRSAANHYSPDAAHLSDLTLGAGIGLTGLVILSAKAPANATPGRTQMVPGEPKQPVSYSFFKSDLFTVGVMYVETMLLTNGVKSTVKNAVERTRPFAYNPAAPLADKLDKDTQRSFYSGHASNAFATAVFAAEIFRHYHPDSKAKPWVWVGSLGLATGTAYLRYEAGQHFPTDLLAGAAIGSLAGWGIPRLHETRRHNGQPAGRANVSVNPWSSGFASGLSIRWSISSSSVVTE
ncbi:phosphatase PAP2 family protein [Fibrella forsythiae]|uniref:Phosphatase PAP2 family protein n=1 Tax=Fibrella forsythiae TaxID=2817061 RepID=A0ABS3JC77_9BACT|nr:phosphatase PAP2 family protein [Fibrella forsythiae]MBO0947600.1 phosphatase PAP2 family protein [Fibrella forsythiae]